MRSFLLFFFLALDVSCYALTHDEKLNIADDGGSDGYEALEREMGEFRDQVLCYILLLPFFMFYFFFGIDQFTITVCE